MSPEITVRNNTDSSTYDASIGDHVVGSVSYERQGSRLVFTHTIVDPEFRGQGIASRLIKSALDDVRAKNASLTVFCSFVAAYIEAHPEYADLLDPVHPGHVRRA